MYLTILGSCRQHSINNIYNCSNIQEKYNKDKEKLFIKFFLI